MKLNTYGLYQLAVEKAREESRNYYPSYETIKIRKKEVELTHKYFMEYITK